MGRLGNRMPSFGGASILVAAAVVLAGCGGGKRTGGGTDVTVVAFTDVGHPSDAGDAGDAVADRATTDAVPADVDVSPDPGAPDHTDSDTGGQVDPGVDPGLDDASDEDGDPGGQPVASGCSDGTREGFIAGSKYPFIAGCGGAWDVPGIHHPAPACGRQAGNTGAIPAGTGCNVEDLCAEGWHVCLGKDDVLARNLLGCGGTMEGARSPAFFLARTSSTGSFNCAPDTIGDPSSLNDLFGCGDLGCPATEATCAPLTMASHDLCKALRNKPTSDCACLFAGELPSNDPSYVAGDLATVICRPTSGGCGWCKPLDYWNKKLGESLPDAWDCGSDTENEASNVVKTAPGRQGGVLCCKTPVT